MLHLKTKSVTDVSLNICKDDIFFTRHDLVYLKTWNISFSSASARKVI